MRNYFFLLFILCASFYNAQEKANPFNEAERESVNSSSTANAVPGVGGPGTGGDGDLEGDDVPIDDYIPALVVTALGIIIYTVHPKKKVVS